MNSLTLIEATLTKLAQLTQQQLNWYGCSQDLASPPLDISNWSPTQPNDKGYLTWSPGGQVQWYAYALTIPDSINGYSISGLSLRLELTWWAQSAQIYVNGKLSREGDLFDSSTRLLITPNATPGETIAIALRLVSPNHDLGALMKSRCLYEKAQDPGFIATQWQILAQYLHKFQPDQLSVLAEYLSTIDWSLVTDTPAFERQLQTISTQLLPLATPLQQYQINLLGHAHLDLAWLWTVSETWKVAKNTFTSVISLQETFPELTFGHTSAVLYQWIEQHHPDLFTTIQTKVKQGTWEILGGMWVEAELNLVGGESIIRQLLYGQRYFRAKFAKTTPIAWLPDSFGFPSQLPQILSQANIDYFLTGKLHWNDTNTFPYGWFNWRSPDGSSVLTLLLPPNLTGVMDTNPLSMSNHAFNWYQQTQLTQSFWLPGVGDHGGGPSQEMLELVQPWSDSPFFPQLRFTTALNYLQQLPTTNLPCWDDELYLEFHRGCYTTHADQKKLNRESEGLIYEAELFMSVAESVYSKRAPFPILQYDSAKKPVCQENIAQAWQHILFNQFHDILPGTSIPEVFTEAQQGWLEAKAIGEKILTESLEAIAKAVEIPPSFHPEAKAIVIFNSLNWSRSELVSISPPSGNWGIMTTTGESLITQFTKQQQLIFYASAIPSVGYRLYWLYPLDLTPPLQEKPREYILDNDYLKVTISSETGDILSIYDQINQKELLSAPGNQLQSFRDQGQYWDAWNIDPNYQVYPLPPTQLVDIQYLETGPLQWSIRVTRTQGNSSWQQDYILQYKSRILQIKTQVDWQEKHTLVKAAFPLTLTSDRVIYGTPCAATVRPTQSSSKWEVCAQGWATIEENNYSISLLSDCKYGYDSQPNQLRLSLLRSPTWPDPEADTGKHEFTYAIYANPGNWQQAQPMKRLAELNLPLKVQYLDNSPSPKSLPPEGSFIDLGADNLILLAFKPGEEGNWILRCYESQGKPARLNLNSDLPLQVICRVNLLEEVINCTDCYSIQPWQIASFLLK